jgi:5-methylcytosine-specific restriction endonuclease McrA
MPPLRPCLGFRGSDCAKLVAGNRCREHQRMYEAARRPNRPTARQRGYTTEHERNRALVLAQSRICWLCGHDGADQADDVVPKASGGRSTLANLRPAHGTEPCPTCGVRCNQRRGADESRNSV